MKYEEMLSRIRAEDDSLLRAKIKDFSVDAQKGKVTVTFINDNSVREGVKIAVKDIIADFLPPLFKNVEVEFIKVKADAELVKNVIISTLKKIRIIAGAITEQDVTVTAREDGFYAEITLIEDNLKTYTDSNGDKKIREALDCNFCEKIGFTAKVKDGKEEFFIEEESETIEEVHMRTITLSNVRSYVEYDGSDTAFYIADALKRAGESYVCGKVVGVRRSQTSKGHEMFSFEITDKTGRLVARMFPRKDKINAVSLIKEGDEVIFKGNMEEYNGNMSFTVRGIGLCEFPKDFVPEREKAKSIPLKYSCVFPQSLEDTWQPNLLKGEEELPVCLMGKTFVVFDLETTGLDPVNDRITEIGAVKIVNGVITDCFTTLINPQKPISKAITDITGIDDKMVKDAPVFGDVAGDFMLYVSDCVLVAHNATFDVSFIKNATKKEGYFVDNDYIDTCEFAKRTILGLKNYKLDTICKEFDIQFLHHRAMSDAHATAKMFIELVKIKKSLPL